MSSQGSTATPPRPRAYPISRDDLNRTKYFGRDFFTFYDDVIFRIQTVFFATFQNFVNSDPALMLVDQTCWAMDLLSFYLDRKASEAYLDTARTREAVSIMTRTIGYKMYGAVPATVDLQVTLDQTYAFVVTYPKGFQWQDASGNVWENVTALTFLPGEVGPKTVSIREGTTKTENFVSDGSISQRFELGVPADKALAWESDEVYVGVTLWTRHDFLTYEATNQYEVDYNGKPPAVVFGDGITGNIPPSSSSITVRYIETLGAGGRVLADRITEAVEPLVIAGNTIEQTVTNPLPSAGGDNAEDLIRAKTLAPQVYRARDVNITRPDYIARATAYSSAAYGTVAMAQAYTARSAASDVALADCMNIIRNGVLYYSGLIATELAAAIGNVGLIESYFLGLDAYLSEAITLLGQVDTNLDDILGATGSILGSTATQEVQIQLLEANLDSLVPVPLPQVTRDALQIFINQIRVAKSGVESQVQVINSEVTSSKVTLASAVSRVGTAQSASTAAQVQLALMKGHVQQAQVYVLNLDDDVNAGLDCIYNHVDEILSDDCKANLVVVPILSTDVDGFYTAPTLSLIAAVQAYLEDRKEVTQTVNVVDGSYYLVPAQIQVTLGVERGYIGEELVAVVDRNIRAILKKRSFGLNLYRSEIHDQCDSTDGVDFSNIRITGPSDHLDSNGNLIVNERETITLGTLTISYVISNPPT
jgi:hypothetical protein